MWGTFSSNVGDLPLRTPIHRRLGGPLPRLLPNGTHPHPLPDYSFNLNIMQHQGHIGY